MIEPGDILYGVCGGAFNKEYGEKIVLAVGRDWVLVREKNYYAGPEGFVMVEQGDPAVLEQYLTEDH
jgi:hypothetical protein